MRTLISFFEICGAKCCILIKFASYLSVLSNYYFAQGLFYFDGARFIPLRSE